MAYERMTRHGMNTKGAFARIHLGFCPHFNVAIKFLRCVDAMPGVAITNQTQVQFHLDGLLAPPEVTDALSTTGAAPLTTRLPGKQSVLNYVYPEGA